MKKTRKNSRIEVWGADYINLVGQRNPKDSKAVIVQIEPGSKSGDYIVEVVDNGRSH